MYNVPILGQKPDAIPAQMRIDAQEQVGKILEDQKHLRLRFGRMSQPSSVSQVNAQYLLAVEALEAAGCTIVAVNEHVLSDSSVMMITVLFRCPESLFEAKH